MKHIIRRGHELQPDELYKILKLRSEVFVVEQQCVFCDIDGPDLEPSVIHLWLDDHGTVASYLRMFDHPPHARIGRVVTHTEYRQQGLAAQLLTAALEQAATLPGVTATVLDAQSHLESYYRQFGYQVAGDEFVEDGIPHVPMRRPQP